MHAPGRIDGPANRVVAVAILALMVIAGALAYWQVFRGDLANEQRNPRIFAVYTNPNRGRILDADGNVLAESLPDGTRRYTDASVAHILGYIDPRYGSQGVELVANGALSGESEIGWAGALDEEFRRSPPEGRDVQLTIEAAVQRAAALALGERKGAVVALDAETGEVLAMVSVPTYDPGALSTSGESLLTDPESPLLNRATRGLYAPGSTFKTVTAAAIFDFNVLKPEDEVTCPGEIVVEGFPISCSNVAQGVGTYPFADAYIYSVNAVFGDVGANVLGWDRLEDMAARLGFGRAIDFEFDTEVSQIRGQDSPRTKVLLASTAFGQGEILATPLQMALVASAVANGGVVVPPHVIAAELEDGRVVREHSGGVPNRAMDNDVAATMRGLMIEVIRRGQAAGFSDVEFTVGGKTGTAEPGDGQQSHAWFISFGESDERKVAVAVVVENGGQGGSVAAPIAAEVLKAALGR
jgi:peptidoglycan glycosyltransferase